MIAIRGATTAINTKADIISTTKELLLQILATNNLATNQIISILFTATQDLDAAYPAIAARELGITHASLMCAQEMHVIGSLPHCIRVQIIAEIDAMQANAKHIYLKEARALRPDLVD